MRAPRAAADRPNPLCEKEIDPVPSMTPPRGHEARPADAYEGNWRNHAACLDEDPELFFPIGQSGRHPSTPVVVQQTAAKAVCHRCPVREVCLRWALETGQDFGVWGGLTEQERRRLRRDEAKRRRGGEAAA